MGGQSGQATVEWVGLVLVAALVLGALAAFRGAPDEQGLGTAVAKRIACAAGGSGAGSGGSGAGCLTRAAAGSIGHAPAHLRGPGQAGAPGVARPAGGSRSSRAQRIDAFRRLRGVGAVGDRLWIVCLGYRRFRYELEHPRAPTEAVPVRDALEIANTCLNPLEFLGD